MISFEHNGSQYLNFTPEEARAAGVPENVILAAESSVRRKLVSAECRRRIYDAASAEAQMNMATAVAVISGKAEADRSADDSMVLDGARLALAWVADMRAAFEALAADPSADFLSDAAWPALPPEVLPMIERF
ncbi:hypothetical protein ETW23_05990 [Leisingera sp. NJS201]|uniref:hypothetical protein n=1 Tax=Leisingera sp. NJS201 TaxID=2508306 RepID=UPI001070EC73|nr:hypothetical protein [Leisingera sp. NJS201]QBR35761.1 hypothetical protein ETW23_05990 [Leisingera sp. NJS201]